MQASFRQGLRAPEVRKLVGFPVVGEVWSDRQLNWVEGLLSLVEDATLTVPDVDFIIQLQDEPYCDEYPDLASAPARHSCTAHVHGGARWRSTS